jgi:hypothetical protein
MFFVVQCYPNRKVGDTVEPVTLGNYATHAGAVRSLTRESGDHVRLAREYPNATFVVRRIRDGRSSVRNTYLASGLPCKLSKFGTMPSDTTGRKKGKIRSRSFGIRRGDVDRDRRYSFEDIAASATIKKHPIDHWRQAFLASNPMDCHKARDPRS